MDGQHLFVGALHQAIGDCQQILTLPAMTKSIERIHSIEGYISDIFSPFHMEIFYEVTSNTFFFNQLTNAN